MRFSVEGESEESVGVLSTQHPILFFANNFLLILCSLTPAFSCLSPSVVGFKDLIGRKYAIDRYQQSSVFT